MRTISKIILNEIKSRNNKTKLQKCATRGNIRYKLGTNEQSIEQMNTVLQVHIESKIFV